MTLTTLIFLIAAAIVIAAVAYLYGRQSASGATTVPPAARPIAPTPTPTPKQTSAPTSVQAAPASAQRAPTTTPVAQRRMAPAAARPGSVSVRSWGYQLQDLNIAQAAASPFDLLVVDPAKDGDDESALTPAEIARLQHKPDGSRRIVLAYLSIGEAESYRGYWKPAWKKQKPAWLLAENPEWEENYAVCFWDPGWQAIMCGAPDARLDRILAAGFDGVYLDKCDVFEDMRDRKLKAAKSRPDLEGDMVRFVMRLSQHAKSKRPDFLVLMQNAESLLERADLRGVLDGSGKEELVFGLDGPEKRNTAESIDWACEQFDLMKREGKLVLVVEYLDAARKVAEAHDITERFGYTLYIAPKDRELNTLRYSSDGGDAVA